MYDPRSDDRSRWRSQSGDTTDKVEVAIGVVLAAFVAGAIPFWCALNFADGASRIPAVSGEATLWQEIGEKPPSGIKN